MIQLRCGRSRAMVGDIAQQDHHGASRLLIDHLFDGRRVLPECDAVGIGDFADQMRRYADAVIGEDGVGGNLLFESNLNRAECDGQVRQECST